MFETGFDIPDPSQEICSPPAKMMKLAHRLVSYGMDQELKECVKALKNSTYFYSDLNAELLLKARRPPQKSLKEKALDDLHIMRRNPNFPMQAYENILLALKSLPDE